MPTYRDIQYDMMKKQHTGVRERESERDRERRRGTINDTFSTIDIRGLLTKLYNCSKPLQVIHKHLMDASYSSQVCCVKENN